MKKNTVTHSHFKVFPFVASYFIITLRFIHGADFLKTRISAFDQHAMGPLAATVGASAMSILYHMLVIAEEGVDHTTRETLTTIFEKKRAP